MTGISHLRVGRRRITDVSDHPGKRLLAVRDRPPKSNLLTNLPSLSSRVLVVRPRALLIRDSAATFAPRIAGANWTDRCEIATGIHED